MTRAINLYGAALWFAFKVVAAVVLTALVLGAVWFIGAVIQAPVS